MTKEKVVPWLLLSVFVPLGLFCIQHAFSERIQGRQSLSWPLAEGTIISAQASRSRSSDGQSDYAPTITYTYTVASNTYNGTRIRFAAVGGGDYSETRAILDKYPAGRPLSVHYNPARPAEAVLEPGEFGRSWGLVWAGAAFMAFGLLVWIFRRQIADGSLRRQEMSRCLGERRSR